MTNTKMPLFKRMRRFRNAKNLCSLILEVEALSDARYDDVCWASQSTLAEAIGVHRHTVRNLTSRLERLGLLEVEFGGRTLLLKLTKKCRKLLKSSTRGWFQRPVQTRATIGLVKPRPRKLESKDVLTNRLTGVIQGMQLSAKAARCVLVWARRRRRPVVDLCRLWAWALDRRSPGGAIYHACKGGYAGELLGC